MTPYATESDVINIYGTQFIEDAVQDLADQGILDGLSQALVEAHDLMLTYLTHRYDEEALRGNSWVIRREARLAGYYLALRRGQSVPQGIQQTHEDTIEDLVSMADNTRRIIPGAPTRHQPAPNISNFEIDNRYTKNRQRRSDADSTSTHSGARPSIYDARYNENNP